MQKLASDYLKIHLNTLIIFLKQRYTITDYCTFNAKLIILFTGLPTRPVHIMLSVAGRALFRHNTWVFRLKSPLSFSFSHWPLAVLQLKAFQRPRMDFVSSTILTKESVEREGKIVFTLRRHFLFLNKALYLFKKSHALRRKHANSA